jgi:hypothetical protein
MSAFMSGVFTTASVTFPPTNTQHQNGSCFLISVRRDLLDKCEALSPLPAQILRPKWKRYYAGKEATSKKESDSLVKCEA